MNDYKDTKWLTTQYVTNRLTCKQIAELCDCASRTIHQSLVRLNIPRRKGGFTSMPEQQKQRWIDSKREWALAHKSLMDCTGKKATAGARLKMSQSRSGPKNWRWRGGVYTKLGYVYVYDPNHPHAHNRSVKRATVVLEKKLGRYLLPNELAHHINGIRNDDRPENLEVMTRSAHSRMHAKEWNAKKKDAAGPVTDAPGQTGNDQTSLQEDASSKAQGIGVKEEAEGQGERSLRDLRRFAYMGASLCAG